MDRCGQCQHIIETTGKQCRLKASCQQCDDVCGSRYCHMHRNLYDCPNVCKKRERSKSKPRTNWLNVAHPDYQPYNDCIINQAGTMYSKSKKGCFGKQNAYDLYPTRTDDPRYIVWNRGDKKLGFTENHAWANWPNRIEPVRASIPAAIPTQSAPSPPIAALYRDLSPNPPPYPLFPPPYQPNAAPSDRPFQPTDLPFQANATTFPPTSKSSGLYPQLSQQSSIPTPIGPIQPTDLPFQANATTFPPTSKSSGLYPQLPQTKSQSSLPTQVTSSWNKLQEGVQGNGEIQFQKFKSELDSMVKDFSPNLSAILFDKELPQEVWNHLWINGLTDGERETHRLFEKKREGLYQKYIKKLSPKELEEFRNLLEESQY